MSDDEFFEAVPPGFQFSPRDDELIHFLSLKINNESMPRNKIREVEFYKFDPDVLADMYKPSGKKYWYFFTKRQKKYKSGSRPSRVAGNGYWRASCADKPIIHKDKEIGVKKSLVYYRRKPEKHTKSGWIMNEFRIEDELDNWVICKMSKTGKTEEGPNGKAIIDESREEDSQYSEPSPISGLQIQATQHFPSPIDAYQPIHNVPSFDHQAGLFPGFQPCLTSSDFRDDFFDSMRLFGPQMYYGEQPSYISAAGPSTFVAPPPPSVDHCSTSNCGPASGLDDIDELIRETLGPDCDFMGDDIGGDDGQWASTFDEIFKGCI
ncbi:NAC domain containing protein 47 [Striga hermonthica]|uniref:NAC domain containing protein 47 n=1 Tax=Striga hermonthica TaxID=68872 RepID=A0A9N7NQZ8_STRHE|nr:NAC domain containing protein 47 [Striga hermonthica]